MIFTPKTVMDTLSFKEVPLNWAASLIKTHRHWWRTEGAGVKIAILDSGINLKHPAFRGAIFKYKNFTEGDEDDVTDDSGHGTHVAGIICARETFNGSMVGIAPRAQIFVAKVIKNGQGEWSAAEAALTAILDYNHEIDLANEKKITTWQNHGKSIKRLDLETGISIVNLSFSGKNPPSTFLKKLSKVIGEGVSIICAAGNEGARYDNGINYPGRLGSVITVGAHGEFGRPAIFSSRGGEIDFLAPGEKIWSTWHKWRFYSHKNNQYKILSGTSMAAPFVTGLSALIISKHMTYPKSQTGVKSCEELRNHLVRMAAHPGYHNQDSGYGPLSPFKNWNKQPIDQYDEKRVNSRRGELEFERDDRTDVYRLRDLDYWKILKKTSSGKIWEDIPSIALRDIIKAQASQVGLMVNFNTEIEYFDSLIKYANQKPHWDFKSTSYTDFVHRILKHPLCQEERFSDQPTLNYPFSRTVFYSGTEGYFFSVSHDLSLKTRGNLLQNDCKESVCRYNIAHQAIIFGYEYEVGMNTDSVPIPVENILIPDFAYGPSKRSGEDWLIIHAKPLIKGSTIVKKLADQNDIERREIESLFKAQKIDFHCNPDVLYSFGHPSGLPLKFAPDGHIAFLNGDQEEIKSHGLDMFGGNSGSPIYSSKDFSLRGVHYEGRSFDSFVPNPNSPDCYIQADTYDTNRKDPMGKLTKISMFREKLSQIIHAHY